MEAGKLLRHWATDAGVSLKELAAAIGVHRTNLSKWLHGHARPQGDQRTAIQQLVAANPQPTCRALPVEAWSLPESNRSA